MEIKTINFIGTTWENHRTGSSNWEYVINNGDIQGNNGDILGDISTIKLYWERAGYVFRNRSKI